MVESVGMQHVLQLSNTVERAQTAQQTLAGNVARVFDHELALKAESQRDQTQETKESERAGIKNEDQRKKKHRAHSYPGAQEHEEESLEPEPPIPESGHGTLINIVA